MDNRVYWIWLQNAFGAGSPKPVQLVRRIGSAAVWHSEHIGLKLDSLRRRASKLLVANFAHITCVGEEVVGAFHHLLLQERLKVDIHFIHADYQHFRF